MKLQILSSLFLAADKPKGNSTMDLSFSGKAEDLSVSKMSSSVKYEEHPLKLKYKSKSFRAYKYQREEINDQRPKLAYDGISQQYENLPWHHALTHRTYPESTRTVVDDAPLDMSLKSQVDSIQKRPSVITCTSSLTPPSVKVYKDRAPSKSESGVCDPVIDEHFRRSLGKDYPQFMGNKAPLHAEETDNVSITVDDHFAKALGDTWLTLQKSNVDDASPKSNSSSEMYRQGLVS